MRHLVDSTTASARFEMLGRADQRIFQVLVEFGWIMVLDIALYVGNIIIKFFRFSFVDVSQKLNIRWHRSHYQLIWYFSSRVQNLNFT